MTFNHLYWNLTWKNSKNGFVGIILMPWVIIRRDTNDFKHVSEIFRQISWPLLVSFVNMFAKLYRYIAYYHFIFMRVSRVYGRMSIVANVNPPSDARTPPCKEYINKKESQ